jgi:hypothetical protein
MKIATGFGFGSKIEEIERPKSDTTTAMECVICDTIFFSKNFGPSNSADACQCRNMSIGIVNFATGQLLYKNPFYIQLKVSNREKVKIYSVYKKNLKRVKPEKNY